MKNKKHNILKKTGITILCILVNMAGRFMAQKLNLPVWLDMTGTCLAIYFAGLASGIITGIVNNIFAAFLTPMSVFYAPVSAAIALLTAYCIKKGCFKRLSITLISGFWIGIISAVVSTPINMIIHKGYSGNIWGDALFNMLAWEGMPLPLCSIAGEGLVSIVDKQLCILLTYGIICMILKNKEENKAAKRIVSMIMAFILLFTFFIAAFDKNGVVYAKETEDKLSDNFMESIYDNSSGMMSSEANIIGETDDGYIWIGSYAGLTRYDGKTFEFIREGGLSSITCMMTDSTGRLWIGSNDSGVARYENGKFTFFTVEDGLAANSIRSFAEDEDGIVYAGTTDRICRIDRDDKIEIIGQDIFYVNSMLCHDGILIGVDNNGKLFGLKKDGTQVYVDSALLAYFCNSVNLTSQGVMLGTSEFFVFTLNTENQRIEIKKRRYCAIENVISIDEDNEGRIWMCGETGVGYYDKKNIFRNQTRERFNSSLECIHVDYQGNIWVASSRYGVLKLSKSRFVDVFSRLGLPGMVVNAVSAYDGCYYCATDSGLVVIDMETGKRLENPLTEVLEGVRIRCLMADSNNRLWVCSYAKNGLISYESSGEIKIYKAENNPITCGRIRCVTEMKDGTIVVGTAEGISFIENGEVTGKLTAEDGLANSQILSVSEGEDGVLYAGSDGGGLYVIRDKKIAECYSTKDGLSSDVILSVVPYDGGFFLITSNSLCYIKEKIEILRNFPYYNNYDMLIDGKTAYVLSSAGIYVVDIDELLGMGELSYRLYNVNVGLLSALTVNSWNYLDEDGVFHLCSNSGVVEFFMQDDLLHEEYKYGVDSIVCDGNQIFPDDNIFKIPADTKMINISPSVRNYLLVDLKVRFYIEGLGEGANDVSYRDLEPIQISNLSSGRYILHFQILDSSQNNILQETEYILVKEKRMWEQIWYRIYLILVCIEIVAFITWSIVIMFMNSRRKSELEILRQELEKKVEEQTEEIRSQQKKTEELYMQTITALSEAVEAKDRYTSGHSRRVAKYAQLLAKRLGKGKEEQEEIYRAGLLHDVGKIRIPEEVITKPGKLTEDEFELIKIHPVTGYHILRGIAENKKIALGAKFHHERYDGKGYPNGLSGENIPEIARIIGVADTYDAMTSNRSYRKLLTQERVRTEIENGKGSQFDPKIADVMLEIINEDKNYEMKQETDVTKKILVVDDEDSNVEMVKFILNEESTYDIFGADSGKKALEILDKQDMDLILLDLIMPEMDGFEVFRRIREKYTMPVVFMTADKDIRTVEMAAEIKADDYITKPFLPLALREIVNCMLKHYN